MIPSGCSGSQRWVMGEEKSHVPALELWNYASGTGTLTEDNFVHLVRCIECQSLVNQFIDVLDELPRVQSNYAA
jgi:hypothetical protein